MILCIANGVENLSKSLTLSQSRSDKLFLIVHIENAISFKFTIQFGIRSGSNASMFLGTTICNAPKRNIELNKSGPGRPDH